MDSHLPSLSLCGFLWRVMRAITIIDAPMAQPVRASDKIAALDKKAKIHGLYRDNRGDGDNQPIRITHVTVILPGGESETREIEPYSPDGVVEGESRPLPEDGADSEG